MRPTRRKAASPASLPLAVERALDAAEIAAADLDTLLAALRRITPAEARDRPADAPAKSTSREQRVEQLAERLRRGLSLWNPADTVHLPEATKARPSTWGRRQDEQQRELS
ncbi:MAG TPA: hypothetical protein VMG10_12110 [Gemmataceae bacterium]|nr:hypothetical protein [Gemmataceae bacterium]